MGAHPSLARGDGRTAGGSEVTALEQASMQADAVIETYAPEALLEEREKNTTTASISEMVLQVGKAVMVAVIVLIVLGQLYGTQIVANPSNPNRFTNLTSTFGQYGEVAFIMIGLGLIAAGGSVAFSFFGGLGGR